MTTKILFVDDEPKLLHAIERRMSVEYDVTTAPSGAMGLKAISEEGPFAVIVTDMRMPKMDGIEFVKEARKIAADSVYMMLTGNQDQATASQAVNEGHVFRFLNKPCQSEDLKRALDTGLRQYKLVAGEKELLHKTFCGAVEVLMDILETPYSILFAHAASIREIVESLRIAVGVGDHWELKLAAKLSLLGFTLMAEKDRLKFEQSVLCDPEAVKLIEQASQLGSKLIEKIPRLQGVSKMIRSQGESQLNLVGLENPAKIRLEEAGAILLRLAMHIDALASQGIVSEDGMKEMRVMFPSLSNNLEESIEKAWPSMDELPTIDVSMLELKKGMVLAGDVTGAGGAVLVRKGRRLTDTIVEKLRCLAKEDARKRTCRIYGKEKSKEEELLAVAGSV